METYPLQPLLAVREYREQSAQQAVKAAERALREAQDAKVEKEHLLESWRVWRATEEERRYNSIMGKPLKMEKIDEFKAGLALLAAEELKRQQDVEDAEKHITECGARLDEAKKAAKAAQKNTAKLTTHKGIWAEEAKKEAERKEDLELEEFKPVSRLGAMAEDEDM